MADWREYILKHFYRQPNRIIIVEDPDDLFFDETIQDNIRRKSFEVYSYSTSLAFHYFYESVWRNNPHHYGHELIIVFGSQSEPYEFAPYELHKDIQKIEVSLPSLFPYLSYPAIKHIEKNKMDDLFSSCQNITNSLSDSETCKFVLKSVYKVDPEIVNNPRELIIYLLRRHYRDEIYPLIIDKYLLRELKKNSKLAWFPLSQIVHSRQKFYKYLQNEWVKLVSEEITVNGVSDSSVERIPFGDGDVRRLLDNLFAEKILTPVVVQNAKIIPEWATFGVVKGPGQEIENYFENNLETVTNLLSHEITGYREWLKFGSLFGQLTYQYFSLEEKVQESKKSDYYSITSRIEFHFEKWIHTRFKSITTLSPIPTLSMVHHIPHYIDKNFKGRKIALIVIDGLNIMHWHQIKDWFSAHGTGYQYDEHAVFAWIPTLTSISRQSIFAGEAPIYFPGSISNTSAEKRLWQKLWTDKGYLINEVFYMKKLADNKTEFLFQDMDLRKITKAGLVVNSIDDMLHGITQGIPGLLAQTEVWLKKGYLSNLFDFWLDKDFDVFVTSDHGFKESVGTGAINQGVLAETRGERCRIYKHESICDETVEQYESALKWDKAGLPDDLFVLVAKGNSAFRSTGQSILGHGGSSLEEVIVPFVRISRRND